MAYEEITDVLLVDFEDSITSTFADTLRMFGFTVEETDDGEIAFEPLSQRRFGMLLLELDLTKRTGIELLAPYRVRRVGAGEHKAVGRLRKPTSPELLIETVRTVCKEISFLKEVIEARSGLRSENRGG